MKEEIVGATLSITLILVCVLLAAGITEIRDRYNNRSKFEVGNVVKVNFGNEFKEDLCYYYVKRVGKEYYLVDVRKPSGELLVPNHNVLKMVLNDHEKVEKEGSVFFKFILKRNPLWTKVKQ